MTTENEVTPPQTEDDADRLFVLYVNNVPRELFDQITREANLMEVPKASYIRGVFQGLTEKDRLSAFVHGKSAAGGLNG